MSAYPPAPSSGHGPAGCWRGLLIEGEKGEKPLSLGLVVWASGINLIVLVHSRGWLFLPCPHRPVRLSRSEAQAGQRVARTQPLSSRALSLRLSSGLAP